MFKQTTAFELRISDWSSDVCSSDLVSLQFQAGPLRYDQDVLCCEQLQVGGQHRVLAKELHLPHQRVDPVDEARDTRPQDRKSVVEGKRVSGRIDFRGRRNINKTNTNSIILRRQKTPFKKI